MYGGREGGRDGESEREKEIAYCLQNTCPKVQSAHKYQPQVLHPDHYKTARPSKMTLSNKRPSNMEHNTAPPA